MKLPLEYEDIIKVLPHRYPFLLVDRIIELDPGKRIVGIKNVTINEPFFPGHFPGKPIMPGVLIIEAMAQVGGVLARLSMPDAGEGDGEEAVFFMAMDKVKFRKPVHPGDQLQMELELLRLRKTSYKMKGKAFVDGELVCEAELMGAIVDRE